MKIKEIRVASPDPAHYVYVVLDDGQTFSFLLSEILNPNSTKNRLMRLMKGKTACDFWHRHTTPVWPKSEPGEVVSRTDSPVKIFLPGIDFT